MEEALALSEEPEPWDDVDEELDWLDGVEDGELSDDEDEDQEQNEDPLSGD